MKWELFLLQISGEDHESHCILLTSDYKPLLVWQCCIVSRLFLSSLCGEGALVMIDIERFVHRLLRHVFLHKEQIGYQRPHDFISI